MRVSWLRIAALAFLVLPGCAGKAPAAPPPSDQVVFSVGTGGGLAPAIAHALASPSLEIYADGRALIKVNNLAIQAVPARYEIAQLDPAAVAKFVSAGEDIVDPVNDFGTPGVTDVGTTTVTLDAGHGMHQVSVYAFDETFETGPAGTSLSPAQKNARNALRGLIDRAYALSNGASRAPFTPDRVAVYELDPRFTRTTATTTWPGPPLSAFLTPSATRQSIACGELIADPAEQVYRAALDNPGALWLVDGLTRVLAVNPLPPANACG